MAEQQETADSGSFQENLHPTEGMDLESVPTEARDQKTAKRGRAEEENDGVSKKQKENGSDRVNLGGKEFVSSVEMFDYLVKFLHFWPTDIDVNKYEHMVLLDLVKKGQPEPEKKIGGGIKAFQIRTHPMWKSRCFFLVREDGTSDDFSFRKSVDHILPLPENMKAPTKSGGGGRGRGRKFGK